MSRRSRVVRIAAIAGVAVLLAYAALSLLLFNLVSSVGAHCGTGDDGRPRFASYSPASFGTDGIPADLASNVDTTAFAMPVFQDVALTSRDGVRLAAWWIPADAPDAPVVVAVHGAGSCRHDPVMLLPAGMLHRNGFSVLMVDVRDEGDSTVIDGRFAGGTDEYLDVLGAWDWVRARGIPASRIGLFGESNGASTVVIAAGAEPLVAATWEDSGYADTWAAISEEVRRRGFPEVLTFGARLWGLVFGIDLDKHRPLDAIASIGVRPLRIVHGLADMRVDPHHAMDFSRALQAVRGPGGPDASPWLVPGAEHTRAAFVVPIEYERRLVEFFRASLGAPTSRAGP